MRWGGDEGEESCGGGAWLNGKVVLKEVKEREGEKKTLILAPDARV